jgi:ribosome maturation factor RimP
MGSMVPESVQELIKAKLGELGFELFDLRFFQAGSRAVLRIAIDSAEITGGGVTIGDCERVSHEISIMLDVEDFSPGRQYTLEVSTPGIDRTLRTERDFKRTIGRFVVLQMAPQYPGKKTLRVKVLGCAEGVLQGEIDGVVTDLSVSQIASGKEELQFK